MSQAQAQASIVAIVSAATPTSLATSLGLPAGTVTAVAAPVVSVAMIYSPPPPPKPPPADGGSSTTTTIIVIIITSAVWLLLVVGFLVWRHSRRPKNVGGSFRFMGESKAVARV